MLLTEAQVRDNLRNRDGKRIFFLGPEDQLTSGARDFLQWERVEIRPAEQAKIRQYRLLNGGTLEEKPEHMTHLQGNLLVPKNHPRIRFRGAVDSLQSDLLLGELQCPGAADRLREIREFSSRILSSEVMEEPFREERLCGLTEEEIRRRSHLCLPHPVPKPVQKGDLQPILYSRHKMGSPIIFSREVAAAMDLLLPKAAESFFPKWLLHDLGAQDPAVSAAERGNSG